MTFYVLKKEEISRRCRLHYENQKPNTLDSRPAVKQEETKDKHQTGRGGSPSPSPRDLSPSPSSLRSSGVNISARKRRRYLMSQLSQIYQAAVEMSGRGWGQGQTAPAAPRSPLPFFLSGIRTGRSRSSFDFEKKKVRMCEVRPACSSGRVGRALKEPGGR